MLRTDIGTDRPTDNGRNSERQNFDRDYRPAPTSGTPEMLTRGTRGNGEIAKIAKLAKLAKSSPGLHPSPSSYAMPTSVTPSTTPSRGRSTDYNFVPTPDLRAERTRTRSYEVQTVLSNDSDRVRTVREPSVRSVREPSVSRSARSTDRSRTSARSARATPSVRRSDQKLNITELTSLGTTRTPKRANTKPQLTKQPQATPDELLDIPEAFTELSTDRGVPTTISVPGNPIPASDASASTASKLLQIPPAPNDISLLGDWMSKYFEDILGAQYNADLEAIEIILKYVLKIEKWIDIYQISGYKSSDFKESMTDLGYNRNKLILEEFQIIFCFIKEQTDKYRNNPHHHWDYTKFLDLRFRMKSTPPVAPNNHPLADLGHQPTPPVDPNGPTPPSYTPYSHVQDPGNLPSSTRPQRNASYVPNSPQAVDSHGNAYNTSASQGGKSTYSENQKHWHNPGQPDASVTSSIKGSLASRWDKSQSRGGDSGGSGTRTKEHKLRYDQMPKTRSPINHKIVWDGTWTTFETYEGLISSQVIQYGAGYLMEKDFQKMYKKMGREYIYSDEFWTLYQIPVKQARYDIKWLYGVLKSSNRHREDQYIEANAGAQDGVLTWMGLLRSYSKSAPSVKQSKIDKLIDIVAKPYTQLGTEGIIDWMDKFETAYTSLDTLTGGTRYTEALMLQDLKRHLKGIPEIAHLLQKISDEDKDFTEAVDYIRGNVHNTYTQGRGRSRSHRIHNTVLEEEPDPPSLSQNFNSNDSEELVPTRAYLTAQEAVDLTNRMVEESNHDYTFVLNTLSSPVVRESLLIPNAIWVKLEKSLQNKLIEVRREVQREQRAGGKTQVTKPTHYTQNSTTKPPKTSDDVVPAQYPSMVGKQPNQQTRALLNQVQTIEDGSSDDDSVDDDALNQEDTVFRISMALTTPIDMDTDIEVRVNNIEYHELFDVVKTVYAISDGGADACVLGMLARIIAPTGRYATLVGYDPRSTRSKRIPIVSAYLKVMTPFENIPVFLKINEAPFYENNPITLISEYQVRDFGLECDSVATKHIKHGDIMGTQRLTLSEDLYIPFEDRGGIMGFQVLPITDDDFDELGEPLFEVHEITQGAVAWKPGRYRKDTKEDVVSPGEALIPPPITPIDPEPSLQAIPVFSSQSEPESSPCHNPETESAIPPDWIPEITPPDPPGTFEEEIPILNVTNENVTYLGEPFTFDPNDTAEDPVLSGFSHADIEFNVKYVLNSNFDYDDYGTDDIDDADLHIFLSNLSFLQLTGHEDIDTEEMSLPPIEPVESPYAMYNDTYDSYAFAVTSWHRVLHDNLDPKEIQPYLGYRPLDIIKKTLKQTTQMAKMIYRAPLRRHIKSRFPMARIKRLAEGYATDPMYANCPCLHFGHTAAQIFMGLKSKRLYAHGFKPPRNFEKIYRDQIREHGIPSVLRRDNAKDENSEAVADLNREYLVGDQVTEPYHPQQNPVEHTGINWLKQASHVLLDRTGAPDAAWFFAVKYLCDVHEVTYDRALGTSPGQFQDGITRDISALLQFKFWQRILYLDNEESWPASKERPGYWLGLAKNVGDILTYWIYDDQMKMALTRSVVRPFTGNHRVRWDPLFADTPDKTTAQCGGDTMPSSSEREELLKNSMDEYDHDEPDVEPETINDELSNVNFADDKINSKDPPESILKLPKPSREVFEPLEPYVDTGFEVTNGETIEGSTVEVEKPDLYDGKSKLRYSNKKIDIDPDIYNPKSVKKIPTKEVKYDTVYHPPETIVEIEYPKPKTDRVTRSQTKEQLKNMKEPKTSTGDTQDSQGEGSNATKEQNDTSSVKSKEHQEPRRSKRIKQKTTQWLPSCMSKLFTITTAAMSTMFLPNGSYADPGFSIMPEGTSFSDVELLDSIKPYDSTRDIEDLRVYHSNLDRINALSDNSEGTMGEWTIKRIDKHKYRERTDGTRPIYLKFTYTDDTKSWLPLNSVRQHDPLLVAQYAINKNIIDKPGWEWVP